MSIKSKLFILVILRLTVFLEKDKQIKELLDAPWVHSQLTRPNNGQIEVLLFKFLNKSPWCLASSYGYLVKVESNKLKCGYLGIPVATNVAGKKILLDTAALEPLDKIILESIFFATSKTM